MKDELKRHDGYRRSLDHGEPFDKAIARRIARARLAEATKREIVEHWRDLARMVRRFGKWGEP